MKRATPIAILVLAGVCWLVPTSSAHAQNRIAAPGWEGFVTRDLDNNFDRCVLYNKSIEMLTADPYDMLGITRSATGQVGLLVFFTPSALKRGSNIAVSLRINDHPTASLSGQALSDFHINIAGPISADTIAALRAATSIEASAEGKSVRFEVTNVGAALDELNDCVQSNERRP
jgi:hypothetical protein